MTGTPEYRPPSTGERLTYDDFVLFPDDGMRHELIDGEHYVTAAPNITHQRILGRLYLLVGNHLQAHPIGEAFLSPFDVVFSHYDVVEPDLLYVSRERAAEILNEKNARGTPELVVEIGSPSTRKRDETIKLRLYERSGVSEYWFIDPETAVIRVYRRAADGFAPPQEYSLERGEVVTTTLLPDLQVPLSAVFPRA
jgi:Uma2 family endonuclease